MSWGLSIMLFFIRDSRIKNSRDITGINHYMMSGREERCGNQMIEATNPRQLISSLTRWPSLDSLESSLKSSWMSMDIGESRVRIHGLMLEYVLKSFA
jgi:hypothetical protein